MQIEFIFFKLTTGNYPDPDVTAQGKPPNTGGRKKEHTDLTQTLAENRKREKIPHLWVRTAWPLYQNLLRPF